MGPDKRHSSETKSRTTAKKSRIDYESSGRNQVSLRNQSSQDASTSQSGISLEAEVGIVERISVTNFMCHSKLDFEFGPNINFIIGRNGSGKSAVLTALVIGLGGTANVTNRGSNIKNFIKNGQSYSVIEVHLRNQGPDAFKPLEYGSNIIIERRILRDGGSTYKIKGKQGKIVATKKEELLAILDQFNIQVENPVSVLNQQTSRSFLSSKSPKDKYSFFLKATQLDQIKQSNSDVAEKLQVAEDMLAQKKELLPQLKREVDDWEKKWQTLQGMQKQLDRVQDYKKDYAWALVTDKENESDQMKEEYSTRLEIFEEKEREVEHLEEILTVNSQERKRLETELNGFLKEMENIKKNNDVTKVELQKARNEFRCKESEKRRALSEIATVNSDLETIQKQIEELVRSEPQDNSAEKQLRQKQIYDFQEQIKELTATKTAQSNHLSILRDSISHYKQNNQDLMHECRNLESQKRSFQQQLADMEGSRKNQLQRFGQCIPTLVACIEQSFKEKRFQKKPIGPIGAYISLRDPKWAVAVETSLGFLLEAFCCDNYTDAAHLNNLIKSRVTQGRKPPVIVSKYQNKVHDVSLHKVICQSYPNILDMLVIKDVNVSNTLIDQKSIESILLIENKSEARRIMTYDVPRNCNQCFTIEGDQIFPVPSFRYYTNNKGFSRYLKGSVEEKITDLKERCHQLQIALQNKNQELRESKHVLEQNNQEERKTENSIARLSSEIGKVNSQVNTLTSFVEPEPVDVSSLEDEVKFFQDKHARLTQQAEALTETVINITDKAEKLKFKLCDSDEKMKVLLSDVRPMKEKVENLNEQSSNKSNDKKALEAELKQEQRNVDLLRKKCEAIERDAHSMREKTEKVCPRRITNRSPANIYSEIVEIEKTLKREAVQQASNDEIFQRSIQSKLRYKKIKEEISDCTEIIKQVKHGMEIRHKSFIHLRTDLVIRIKYLFSTCLKTRKYNGDIRFNHKTGTLTFQVQPNENVKELCDDMRSLSGGERSFSTVCFILSLWDAMESPFRILDEYDVFMDMVNRRISMDMMMEVARSKLNHQFIFLTPLEMSKICASRTVKICRMPDPERSISQEEEDN